MISTNMGPLVYLVTGAGPKLHLVLAARLRHFKADCHEIVHF